VAAQLTLITAGGALSFFLLRRASVDSTGASLLVGVALAVIGFVQNRQVERRQRTVELIAALQNTDTLSAADGWMADRISRAEPVHDDVPKADDQQVITLLDYYEFLCILTERGHLDGDLLADLREPAMRRAFEICEPYVRVRRERVGTELYQRYGRFVDAKCLRAVVNTG